MLQIERKNFRLDIFKVILAHKWTKKDVYVYYQHRKGTYNL